jgi:hypothetical protein
MGLSVVQRTICAVQMQTEMEREAYCPVCRRRHIDVVVGMFLERGGPLEFWGQLRRPRKGPQERTSDLRPWLDPVIKCRRGHRLQVPFGADVQRLLRATPRNCKVYLRTAPVRLQPIPQTEPLGLLDAAPFGDVGRVAVDHRG